MFSDTFFALQAYDDYERAFEENDYSTSNYDNYQVFRPLRIKCNFSVKRIYIGVMKLNGF
jgi:hypothetical protein